jgi:hypothetical protein
MAAVLVARFSAFGHDTDRVAEPDGNGFSGPATVLTASWQDLGATCEKAWPRAVIAEKRGRGAERGQTSRDISRAGSRSTTR